MVCGFAALALVACAEPPGPSLRHLETVYVDRDTARTVDLSAHVSARSVDVRSTADVEATVVGEQVTLTPRPGFTGLVALDVEARRAGKRVTGTLPVRVKDRTVRCETVFRYEGDAASVHVAGDFNGFSATALPMEEVGLAGSNIWEVAVALAPGDHAYKLVVDGSYRLDEASPLSMWVDGIENSRVVAEDCARPRVDLFEVAVSGSNGTVSAVVAFVAASDGQPAAGTPQITIDGLAVPPAALAWEEELQLLRVNAAAPEGKRTFEVTAVDGGGRATVRSFPFWIDGARGFAWEDAVLYFVLTDRFRNGDAANDAPVAGVDPKANYQGGDWDGLRLAIEEGYFDALGVNVLWISPHVDNPDGAFAGADARPYSGYHGYWPAKGRIAEERFGGMDDLKAAIDAAHARGIRVILDVVLNHVHDEHEFWVEHPGAPWFHSPEYVCGYDQPLTCSFASYLPDLDHRTLDTMKAVVADAKWWAEETGADGFRVDAVKHFEHAVGRTLRHEMRDHRLAGDRFWMVGETFVGRWTDAGQADTVKAYVGPRELDGQFDFPLHWEIVRTIGRGEGTLRDLEKVVRESQGFYGPEALMGTFLGNHDVSRFVSHANGDIADLFGGGAQEQGWTAPPAQPASPVPYARMRAAFTLLFALPGVPTIYYGDEIGLAGAGDPDNRRPLPWSGITAEQEAVRDHVAALAGARQTRRELSRGTARQVFLENEVLVLERAWEGRYAYVAINRGASARSIAAPSAAQEGIAYVDVVNGTTARVEGGILALEIPAGGSSLYVVNESESSYGAPETRAGVPPHGP